MGDWGGGEEKFLRRAVVVLAWTLEKGVGGKNSLNCLISTWESKPDKDSELSRPHGPTANLPSLVF